MDDSQPWLNLMDLMAITIAAVMALSIYRFTPFQSRLPLPPGPKSSWFGKISLPKTNQWRTYTEWKDIYGDLIYVYVFGNPILILNSATAASDLLEKRGSNYSSRPFRTMVTDLMGWDWLFSGMPYGEFWKRHRNVFHRHFRPNDASPYHLLQTKETHTLLRNLQYTPENFRYHVRRTAAAIILNVAYGHQVADEGDDYVTLADQALSGLAKAGIFGTYLVDYVPILRHIPVWFPFATFRRQALKWRELTRAMVDQPFEVILQQMKSGTATPCLVTEELERRSVGSDFEDEQVIKNVAATLYAAGSDTFVSGILSFFLVMALYPDIQQKAQAELDCVVNGRLPEFCDKKKCPFIESLCYELLRWNPVTPMGLAHFATETDEYRGYRIPKGTALLPNVWGILHDPNVYPDPLTFDPMRFMDRKGNVSKGINELPDAAFGFGRRMCPGRWFAFDTMWIIVASILSSYNITKAVDGAGNTIEPEIEYSSGLSHPKPFKCHIAPRSLDNLSLVEQTSHL
ncbi:cytochrome P450 [Collybia nuda]|uniref:Cytochrome P450 n=1 Tax=Collybia nuda TaxID=64659 RepID=A0A9P5Y1Y5_9AGAR|nr:cytochrome P450 [Collybia nuda]